MQKIISKENKEQDREKNKIERSMNWKSLRIVIFAISILGMMLAGCQFGHASPENETPEPDIVETLAEPTFPPEAMDAPLPERSGPRTQTTGTVPHVQINVEPVPAINDELYRRAYSLPGVEDRPTIVSLPGARGMWLSDDIPLAHPEAIVDGREFAHIHPDGSLHAPLPYERALEVDEKGWGERHPWADERDGWDGFVMLYTPQTMAELEIIFQLIVESYNHVTGQALRASDF